MKESNENYIYIWVFNGDKNRYSSGVFSTFDKARHWIFENKLSGMLTKYPVDISVYDWCKLNEYFKPKTEKHFSSEFISNFTSASQEHFRFDDGNLI